MHKDKLGSTLGDSTVCYPDVSSLEPVRADSAVRSLLCQLVWHSTCGQKGRRVFTEASYAWSSTFCKCPAGVTANQWATTFEPRTSVPHLGAQRGAQRKIAVTDVK